VRKERIRGSVGEGDSLVKDVRLVGVGGKISSAREAVFLKERRRCTVPYRRTRESRLRTLRITSHHCRLWKEGHAGRSKSGAFDRMSVHSVSQKRKPGIEAMG